MKDCLSTKGYMTISPQTTAGSWEAAKRRNWCNGGFRQALPEMLRPLFKQFICRTGTYRGGYYSGGSNITTYDYFAFAAETEVLDARSGSTQTEANVMTQFDWYISASNKVKKIDESAVTWWERSPCYSRDDEYCRIWTNGTAHSNFVNYPDGISPFGCL